MPCNAIPLNSLKTIFDRSDHLVRACGSEHIQCYTGARHHPLLEASEGLGDWGTATTIKDEIGLHQDAIPLERNSLKNGIIQTNVLEEYVRAFARVWINRSL